MSLPRERTAFYDVAVVGAGIAGSALAARLAKAGRSVALLERDAFPREKLCGEFLSPECLGLFARLGCREALEALGPARIGEARLYAPSGRRAVLDLGGEGWGLSRRALDAALFRHAAEAGAAVFDASPVLGVDAASGGARLEVGPRRETEKTWRLNARVAVLAHGRRGALDRVLERPFLHDAHPFLGLKRHHRPAWTPEGARLRAELKGAVELHFFAGGYCGLSFVEEGLVNACLLLHRGFLERLGSTRWEAVSAAASAASPSLAARLAALEPAEEAMHAVAGIPFAPKEASAGGLLFVGDAAGMIAPLCGSGQAFALAGAQALAAELSAGAFGPELAAAAARRWETLWRLRFAPRVRRGQRLQHWALKPWAAAAFVEGLRLFPGLGRRLLAATRAAAILMLAAAPLRSAAHTCSEGSPKTAPNKDGGRDFWCVDAEGKPIPVDGDKSCPKGEHAVLSSDWIKPYRCRPRDAAPKPEPAPKRESAEAPDEPSGEPSARFSRRRLKVPKVERKPAPKKK